MDKDTLIHKIDEVSIMLYQNREQEAVEQVAELLPVLQQAGKGILQRAYKTEEEQELDVFIASILRELIEGYRNKDMLYLADCLQQKGILLAELYASTR